VNLFLYFRLALFICCYQYLGNILIVRNSFGYVLVVPQRIFQRNAQLTGLLFSPDTLLLYLKKNIVFIFNNHIHLVLFLTYLLHLFFKGKGLG
jgi:hypothetical protein